MPARKRRRSQELTSTDTVLAILREVRGIMEAAAFVQGLQTPQIPVAFVNTGQDTTAEPATDEIASELRAAHEERQAEEEWFRRGTGRNT